MSVTWTCAVKNCNLLAPLLLVSAALVRFRDNSTFFSGYKPTKVLPKNKKKEKRTRKTKSAVYLGFCSETEPY